MNESESLKRASAAALRLLSYRVRSEAEVRVRLRRRFPAHVVEKVMKSLAEKALVDDSSFARLWRGSRDSLNPRSATAIREELVSKGVARDVADAAVRDADDLDSAYRAGYKLALRLELADSSTFRHRLWGYLKRRGFSDSVTRHTIARLRDESQRSPSQPPSDAAVD